MSLRVINPGTYSLLVDSGRPRTRSRGVAMGGPADRAAHILGNELVGNRPDALALEITLSGPTLIADSDLFAIVMGSPFNLHRDEEPMYAGHVFQLRKDQTLRIGGTESGCRSYLCVAGGFNSQLIAGSQSNFLPIKSDETLQCESRQTPILSVETSECRALLECSNFKDLIAIRCLVGPQYDWFTESIFDRVYRVTTASNRMGLRLDGQSLMDPNRDMISEPVAPGAIQIANDGKPIILGVDGQTIGGYPKPANVIDADLDVLGQLRPGQSVKFVRVTEQEAEEAGELYRDMLKRWSSRIRLMRS